MHSKGFNAVNHDYIYILPRKRRIEVKCSNFSFISCFNLVIVLHEHLLHHGSIMAGLCLVIILETIAFTTQISLSAAS